MPEKCKKIYVDFTSGKFETYKCEEDAVEDGLCIFHHPEYWKEHKDEVRKKFMEKVEDAINSKKPLLCIDYNLPEVDLSKKKFEAPVYFTGAIFHEGADFSEATFSGADFSEATFSIADFRGATFSYIADFSEATFSSKADFSEATFSIADFSGTTFSNAYFSEATFSSKADFSEATFSIADFSEATFSIADFSGTTFSDANFRGTKFSYIADFSEATFSNANFRGATFSGADFRGTTFSSIAYFSEATFSSKADFSEAIFSYIAYFYRTKFSDANFRGTTFFSTADFIKATFSSKADFIKADFEEVTAFEGLKTNNNSFIVFESCTFKKPHLVSFRGTEIMRFLFLSTEIEKISLRNAKFNEKILKVHELLKDPKFQFKNPKSQTNYTFDDVIETYGRLRGNFERNHRFSEAGKFFVGEMEVRRMRKYYEFLREHEKSKKEGFKEWLSFNLNKLYLKVYTNFLSPFALYKAFSEYGESILRPFLWSLLTILVMPMFFILLGGRASLQSFISSYGSNLVKSFGLFAQILPVDYPPPSLVTFIEVLERLLAILFAGLELMALKRRLERHR